MPSNLESDASASTTGRWKLVVARRSVLLKYRSSPAFVAFETFLALVFGAFLPLKFPLWVLPPYVLAVGVVAVVQLRGVKRFKFIRDDLLVFRPVLRWIGLPPRRVKRPHAVRTRRDWPSPRYQGTNPIHVVEVRDDDGVWRVAAMIPHEGDARLVESMLRRALAAYELKE